MSSIIDGKSIAKEIELELIETVSKLQKAPRLSVVQVGEDPASSSYIKAKANAAKRVGINLTHHHLPIDTSIEKLEKLVDDLNESEDGLIIQLPIPQKLEKVLERIKPENDVDGFHSENLGKLIQGKPGMVPCTPAGIVELLYRSGNDPSGKHVTIVGTPLSLLLSQKGVDATVTLCHSRTKSLEEHCKKADILVAAVGKANMISKNMVKPGAVIIDVGVNRTSEGLVGDVSSDVKEIASQITPVPGGVGPMTVVMLMSNTVKSALEN